MCGDNSVVESTKNQALLVDFGTLDFGQSLPNGAVTSTPTHQLQQPRPSIQDAHSQGE